MNILNSIQHMFQSVSGDTWFGKLLIAGGALLTAYITPIVGLLTTCFAMTSVDMLYGIKVAKQQGQKITSKKNWKGTLIKIRDEFTLIILAHLLEFNIFPDSIPFLLSGGTTAIIALTELWSIIENLNTIDPDGPWKTLGRFLVKKGEDYVGIDLNGDGVIGSNKPSVEE